MACSLCDLHYTGTARDGAGAPQSCALCDQYCSSNAVSTIMDLKEALWFDVVTVVHLMAKCFGHLGLAGCICQLSMTLQPAWRAHSTNDKVRCTNGDPWELMLDQVNSQIVEWAEWGLNQFVNTFNKLPIPLVPDIPPICWNTKVNPDKCPRNASAPEHFRECENPTLKGGVDLTCYYHRVRACTLATHPPCYTIPHTRTHISTGHSALPSLPRALRWPPSARTPTC